MSTGNLFQGVSYIPGVGHVEGGAISGPLGDEHAVMMISGLGEADPAKGGVETHGQPTMAAPAVDLLTAIRRPTKVFGIELPLWLWLLILAGVVGAGYVFFYRKK